MPINIKVNPQATITLVKLESKSDLDQITSTFDCYTNPALPDEAILDTTFIDEDDESRPKAIELFGETNWDLIADGFVLFHP